MQVARRWSRLQHSLVEVFLVLGSHFPVYLAIINTHVVHLSAYALMQPATGVTEYIALNDTRPPEGQGGWGSPNENLRR